MGNENNRFTKQQEAAIKFRGGPLLVSSAAGSGKTMVLVERLLGYINQGFSIDEFLVITYTRAAAGELRSRIYERLGQQLEKNPSNRHLRRQQILCAGACIDTIHTFCSMILRENAHLSGLSPDFRVADESESALLKAEILDDVFERTYDRVDECEGLQKLLLMTIEGRDDQKLKKIVSDIYEKLGSIPDRHRWIEIQLERMHSESRKDDVSQTMHGRYLMSIMRSKAGHIYSKLIDMRNKMADYPEFVKAHGDCTDELISATAQLLSAFDISWDEAAKRSEIKTGRAKPVSGYEDFKAIRKWCLNEISKINKNLVISSKEHMKDANLAVPVAEELFKLVLLYDEAYSAEKQRRNIADFSDLEHMALTLLTDGEGGKQSAAAEAISARYKEILVDEYQDVNEVQEEIFNAITGFAGNSTAFTGKDCGRANLTGSSIFMVGDVKQSIYRFRLAEPGIFLSKYNSFDLYIPDNGEQDCLQDSCRSSKNADKPAKINLSMNFRSRPGILKAVNYVFGNIMSETFGELNYSDEQALAAGREEGQGKQGIQGKQGEWQDFPVEFDLISANSIESDEDEISLTSIEIEASHIAGRINEMTQAPYFIDAGNGQSRQVVYSDIAILSRSAKGITWRYAKALKDAGIPAELAESEEFFSQTEVEAALSLLSVIDNPLQDIHLAAVLRGPVYSLTSDEMAKIRLAGRAGEENNNGSYYDALKKAQHPNGIIEPELAEKCKEILGQLDELRGVAYDMPADRFIWHIYNKTELIKKVSAMPDGAVRKENLLALASYAQNIEKNGYKGLFGFLCYIKALRERGDDIPLPAGSKGASGGASPPAGSRGAVKILTIHKSKGLEFPVVFIANMSKQHNTTDLRKPYVFHKELGIGAMLTDTERRIKYTTLARMAITEKLRREMLSEELRVLYVAMTRAREKLIMVATFNDAEDTMEKIKMLGDGDGKYSPEPLMSMNSVAHWVIAGTMNIPEQLMKINMCSPADKETAQEGSIKASGSRFDGKGKEEKTELDIAVPDFSYRYPFEASTKIPSKLTVTGLKSIADPEAENAAWLHRRESAAGNIRRPYFVSEKKHMSASGKGTLIHNIFRYIDFKKCTDENAVRSELQRITVAGFIDAAQSEHITDEDISSITAVFASDLGQRMIRAIDSNALSKEFQFSLLVPAGQYFKDGGDDKILLQGVVDCFFTENGETVIVDFKTDRVDETSIEERVKRYTPQLEGYAGALMRITNRPVKEKILYFISIGKAINV